MAKISELGKITGANTKSNDLFVTVSLEQGEDGTKNITRAELVNAIEQEVFDNIKVDGGEYIRNIPLDNVTITDASMNSSTIDETEINDSTINNSEINDPVIIDPNITVNTDFTPNISNDDYFYLKDVSLGETVAISYSQLYDEIAKSVKKAKKIYVSVDGDDNNPGSYIKPVATLEKAVQMANAAAETVPTDILGRRAVHITVNPGSYYTNGELSLPNSCSVTSSSGQYTTNIVMNPGYESKNCFLLGSGCYVQGFSFFNFKVDNFDDPTGGFAFAFRPGVRITRSPYIRDCSQISNYFERDIPPLLNPFNSRGTIDDLGYELSISSILPSTSKFEVGDRIETSNGVAGVISRVAEIGSGTIYVRNNTGLFEANTSITTSSGGTASIIDVGEEDYPNKDVGRGGGMILADRAHVDQDSLFPYILAFGATPRTQNGLGYVAKNGAGINGISSLSIFSRCAFYALNGGQITLNNSGTQFGDISMRAKGSTPVFNPYQTSVTLSANTVLADTLTNSANTIIDDLIDNYITANTSVGGLGLQTYNSTKCERDVGYILEGVGYDLALGTNYWSIVNGIAYRRAESEIVVDEQLVETSGAIEYLKSTVAELLEESPESVARTDDSFDEIIDILENGIASADALVFSSTGNSNFNKARALLIANRTLIQNSVISYIDTTYPSLVYDEALCFRDTGFIVDALTHDLNYNSNIATIVNAEAYFTNAVSTLPVDQRSPTADAIRFLGTVCSSIMLGTFSGQSTASGIATQAEATRCIELASVIERVISRNSLQELPGARKPDLSWVSTVYRNSKEVIEKNVKSLKKLTVAFVNSEYNFIDDSLTRRDARNLITAISNDFKLGRQTGTRIFTAGLFNFQGKHVFSVFNPNTVGLNYIGSYASTTAVSATTVNVNDAIIVYTSPNNLYEGTVYYSNGSAWVSDGANDIDLLNAFTGSFNHIRTYIKDNITTSAANETMLDGLIDDVLIDSVRNPNIINFGSLVESLSHQFNLASAGVNINALPLNFRRLGAPISASASVSQEDGGRVRWSGADELNNQYFARGLKINGRTGRLEGRPFTSSVRKLARRASNSRAIL
jgi:hypothetical protein